MKYCSHCGKELLDESVVCPHCGCAVSTKITLEDVPSLVLNIISFFFPLIALLLYVHYQDKAPKKAKAIMESGVIGIIIVVSFWVIIIFT